MSIQLSKTENQNFKLPKKSRIIFLVSDPTMRDIRLPEYLLLSGNLLSVRPKILQKQPLFHANRGDGARFGGVQAGVNVIVAQSRWQVR